MFPAKIQILIEACFRGKMPLIHEEYCLVPPDYADFIDFVEEGHQQLIYWDYDKLVKNRNLVLQIAEEVLGDLLHQQTIFNQAHLLTMCVKEGKLIKPLKASTLLNLLQSQIREKDDSKKVFKITEEEESIFFLEPLVHPTFQPLILHQSAIEVPHHKRKYNDFILPTIEDYTAAAAKQATRDASASFSSSASCGTAFATESELKAFYDVAPACIKNMLDCKSLDTLPRSRQRFWLLCYFKDYSLLMAKWKLERQATLLYREEEKKTGRPTLIQIQTFMKELDFSTKKNKSVSTAKCQTVISTDKGKWCPYAADTLKKKPYMVTDIEELTASSCTQCLAHERKVYNPFAEPSRVGILRNIGHIKHSQIDQ